MVPSGVRPMVAVGLALPRPTAGRVGPALQMPRACLVWPGVPLAAELRHSTGQSRNPATPSIAGRA